MKTTLFKSFIQVSLFVLILISSISLSISVYKSIKQVYNAQHETAVSCLFDIMQ